MKMITRIKMYELRVIYNYSKSNNYHKIHLLKHYNFNNMNKIIRICMALLKIKQFKFINQLKTINCYKIILLYDILENIQRNII